MRVGKFALIVPVMTSTEGRCVARTTCNPAARAICARPRPAPSVSLAGALLQAGLFADSHHNVRKRLKIEFLLFIDGFAGLAIVAGVHRARELFALAVRFG